MIIYVCTKCKKLSDSIESKGFLPEVPEGWWLLKRGETTVSKERDIHLCDECAPEISK